MDWISSSLRFLLEQFAHAAQQVDLYLDLPKVVIVCAAVLIVLSLTLANSKR
jgi:hypothetical protein